MSPELLAVGPPSWVSRGASLDMDFANGRYFAGGGTGLSGLLTTTRASTGYAATSSGLLVPFAANIPRITDLGLLPEQAATNLALQSNTFNTTWATINAASVTANSATDPTNANNGWLLASASNFGGIQQTITIVSGTTYTASAFCKAGTTHIVGVQFRDGTSTNIVGVKADLNTGTVTGTEVVGNGVLIASGIISFGNGWYRVWVAGTITSTNGGIAIMDRSNAPINIDIFGAQLEASAFATSYIPTTTVSVNRPIDNEAAINALLTALQSASGTVIISLSNGLAATVGTILGINALIGLGKTAADKLTTAFGGTQTSGNSATWTGNVKVGLRWTPTAVAICLNGGTIVTAANTPPAVTSASIGSTSGSSAAVNQSVKRITIIPSAVSDATFQALCT